MDFQSLRIESRAISRLKRYKKPFLIPKAREEFKEILEKRRKNAEVKVKKEKKFEVYKPKDWTHLFIKNFPPIQFREVEISPKTCTKGTFYSPKTPKIEKNRVNSGFSKIERKKTGFEQIFCKASASFVHDYSMKYGEQFKRPLSPWKFQSSVPQSFIFPQ